MAEISDTIQSERARSRIINGMIVIALAALVAILWLPFGLNVGFTGDAWIYFHQISQGSMMSQAAPTRLLWPIPYLIAYGLVPGQFASFNLFLALLFFAKGCLIYALLRRFSASPALAFAAAALAIILPVDSGTFYLGAISIEFAVVMVLLATYLLILHWRRPSIAAPLAMAIAELCSVGMYELVYPLILVTPLALLWFRRKIDRRLIRTAALWYVTPALYAGWYLFIVLNFPRAFQYQSGLIASSGSSSVLISLFNIYRRHFWDAWVGSLAAIPSTDVVFGLLAGGIAFAVGVWLRKRMSSESAPRLTLALVLGGLVILFLGVALYLPTSVRDQTYRTYYFSSVGAAITLAGLLDWIGRRPLIFGALVGILAGLGTAQLLNQHQQVYDTSKSQQAILTEFARALPQIEPGTGIVIVDESPDQTFTHLIGTLDVEDTIPLIYQDDTLESALCLPGDFGTAPDSRCRFSDTGIQIPSVRTYVMNADYSKLILVRYDGAFSVVTDLTPYAGESVAAYQPELRYHPDGAPPARIHEMFGM